MIYREPIVKPAGDSALRVTFGDERTRRVNRPVRAMYALLMKDLPTGVTELVPTYASLTAFYEPLLVDPHEIVKTLKLKARQAIDAPESESESRLLRVPVCYEGQYAPDMEYICDYCGLDRTSVIQVHTSAPYFVFQLGFTPGCPFLGPLQKELHVPLMETPRTHTPKGAVAISVGQTVIYPRATPGGMRIVGQTPVQLFQLDHPDLTLFKPGDKVQFYEVSASEYVSLQQRAERLMDCVEEVRDG